MFVFSSHFLLCFHLLLLWSYHRILLYKPHLFGQILGLKSDLWVRPSLLEIYGFVYCMDVWPLIYFNSYFKQLIFAFTLGTYHSNWHGIAMPLQSCLHCCMSVAGKFHINKSQELTMQLSLVRLYHWLWTWTANLSCEHLRYGCQ